MKHLLATTLALLFLIACSPTIPPSQPLENIKIARDKWGVPHIFAPTNAEVAYGLAWAECEDDFKTIQEQILATRGRLGELKGKAGIIIDFGIHYMGLREVVEKHFDTTIKGEFKEYLSHFVTGMNSYAALHPEEVLLKGLFPVKIQDILMSYLLGSLEISGAGQDLQAILNGKVKGINSTNLPTGSNAFAISSKKTKDGQTYLAINSHQPLEGWYSWYEAHLHSEEGLNILGGTFPGGSCIFHGVNENIGWAHTVNHADFSDVYALKMHPKRKWTYQYDGKWKTLKKKQYKAKLKLLGFIKLPIRKTIYESIYGPTFKTKNGFFSWRYVVAQGIGAAEQWYEMNKASDLATFRKALAKRGIASTNIVYADRADNIFFISNGNLPLRNPQYNWSGVLPGDTSATFWGQDYFPLDSLPQVLNPTAGYVFNTNNTPFSSTAQGENPIEDVDNQTMNYQPTGMENNRSRRFKELIEQYDSLDYATFKAIKYDNTYPSTLTAPHITNLEILLQLDATKYPTIKEAILLLQKWDRSTDKDNTTAALFILSLKNIGQQLRDENRHKRGNHITELDCIKAISKAQEELRSRYGTLSIPLGTIQRHIRFDKSLPLGGGPDVLAAMYSREKKDGIYKGIAGESYILLARFSKEGVQLESVNAYGTNAEKGNLHATDQMDLFVNQRLKPMSLDKAKILKEALRVYSPNTIRIEEK